ncbi:cbb3-type cytochrome oxidase assembly protein CcoS [Hansschlegelia zhihuaiae]|uniref:Cbb3-type cytochrome oxidase assembly protein CcoS n=1 Tax=Hansschlegelia zhihuaiae TaxID=405005 RepID=A0A4Q0MCR3_9HYPH|nr:cbb3-type cytochrome oxidase assembly protein CcoS [Hansschlegelia zhihuaiae]RXF70985.1 cbb3-type cytochrome oxidase assembly protein CcoS [Hansschlegelia zhihuaiae]
MDAFLYLVPLSLMLGAAGLAAFLWSLSDGQYEDLDGSAERILYDEGRPTDPRDRAVAQPGERESRADFASAE